MRPAAHFIAVVCRNTAIGYLIGVTLTVMFIIGGYVSNVLPLTPYEVSGVVVKGIGYSLMTFPVWLLFQILAWITAPRTRDDGWRGPG